MRRYLAEFLADPRVVGLPRLVWLPVLHGAVLPLRPRRSAKKYAAIWTAEGSPLAVHTRRQAELLGAALPAMRVEYAMRYGAPGIATGLARFSGCERVVVLPLYPQYSDSTTGSVLDVVGPRHPVVRDFHDHPAYLAALAAGIRRHWERHGRGDMLVLSFHGLPKVASERGDPYEKQCRATAERLVRTLALPADRWRVSFQSRFGAARWLGPYTQPTLLDLARRGVSSVDVAFPGFVADCLETLHEIGIEARDAFRAAGGRELRLVPCLNEAPEWIEALARIAAAPGRSP